MDYIIVFCIAYENYATFYYPNKIALINVNKSEKGGKLCLKICL